MVVMATDASNQLQRFLALSSDLFAIIDHKSRFTYLSPAWEKTVGYPLAELYAEPLLSFIHPEDAARTRQEAEALASGEVRSLFENRFRCQDGHYRWLQWSGQADGENPLIYAVARDVTALKRVEHERDELIVRLQDLAFTDPLTNIYNRRAFFMLAERELARSKRVKRPLAAVMLDIDRFKTINDTFGHAVGDHVLRSVAQCCRGFLRAIDILGRYGGEEFSIVLVEVEPKTAHYVAERLREQIARLTVPITDQQIKITASFGVAVLSPQTATIESLFTQADQALLRAKQEGRNKVVMANTD